MQFNKEHIPSPSGGQWSQSAINGNRKRGTGILNNVLYIGQLVWNRQRFIKDPSTGRRVTRMNNEDEWVKQDVPELRIIPQELWDTVKARQKTLDRKTGCLGRKKRPQYLLSGLLECGSCGGGDSKIRHNAPFDLHHRQAGVCCRNTDVRPHRDLKATAKCHPF